MLLEQEVGGENGTWLQPCCCSDLGGGGDEDGLPLFVFSGSSHAIF